ncbi:MAG: site-specific DNA-methyltransferase, partial [Clostridiales bacterium]|nr:site-specific DNA-methyltransferase [Clostridiales bacterium]
MVDGSKNPDRSPRNKTIDFDLAEGHIYTQRCLKESDLCKDAPVLDKTIWGDTFSALKKLPDQSVDLLIADPYYNLSKRFHGDAFKKESQAAYRAYTQSWLERALPLLKKTASVYVCCDWESSLVIGAVLGECLTVRNRITWQREKGRGANKNWKNGLEDIWFATVSDDYVFNLDAVKIRRRVLAPYTSQGAPKDWEEGADGRYRSTCPSNFWDDISIPYWSMRENTAHPTQKPEKLIAKLILAGSNPGGVVLDPFLGSGTTSVTAKKLGRRYIGIEQNPLYCAWAEYRLEKAETDT